jgi:hypothetical protein
VRFPDVGNCLATPSSFIRAVLRRRRLNAHQIEQRVYRCPLLFLLAVDYGGISSGSNFGANDVLDVGDKMHGSAGVGPEKKGVSRGLSIYVASIILQ